MDFAKRAVDHLHYDIDPIVRNRLDNDFYKLTMRRVVLERHAGTRVRYSMTNRTTDVRLADLIPIEAMREQLDHARTLRYEPSDLHWIAGNTFYGEEGMFPKSFISALKVSRLPEYELGIDAERGQFTLETEGSWPDAMDWEDYFLTITNEMRNRALMRGMSALDIDVMYARAKSKFYAKLERLARFPDIRISEFGTRRRHSHPWQEWIIRAMVEVLGDQMVGTSNSYFARKLGIEAKGTNAHEMPMVYAALAAAAHPDDDDALVASQYEVLRDWQASYGDKLRMFLPDAFGTTQFLRNSPEWLAWWMGARPDSKDAHEAGEELIEWWRAKGQDPANKTILFSDGLDVRIPGFEPQGDDVTDIHEAFRGRVSDAYGWGTMATNDFIGCVPGNPDLLRPISLVCKVHSVNGHPAVKISDNPAKASSSSREEIARYMRAFGCEGIGDNRGTIV